MGNIRVAGFDFVGPYYFNKKFKSDFGAVYLLLSNDGKIVDVGETQSINTRIVNHERRSCWIQHGCSELSLYVFINQDQSSRLALERLVRIKFSPPCGDR